MRACACASWVYTDTIISLFNFQDGPDILVCDEAHIIKNTQADTTQALKQVKCQRRIALTGSPLQNNLMEYYCVSCMKSTNAVDIFMQCPVKVDEIYTVIVFDRWLIL